MCGQMIDDSNNETWGSRVKKNVGKDEKQLIKFSWMINN